MKNRGWVVTCAGMGINLALGVLYTWSVIKKAIPAEWGWSDADKALPYSIACIVFALVMVPAGRLQDRIGPRWVATAGGVLTGIGCIVASYAVTVTWFVIGFGVFSSHARSGASGVRTRMSGSPAPSGFVRSVRVTALMRSASPSV